MPLELGSLFRSMNTTYIDVKGFCHCEMTKEVVPKIPRLFTERWLRCHYFSLGYRRRDCGISFRISTHFEESYRVVNPFSKAVLSLYHPFCQM